MNGTPQTTENLFRVRLPDFDMGEMRGIQYKQRETGIITADEPLRIRKAGFNRPREVPSRPEPRDPVAIRKRAKERAFGSKPWLV
jgi:hypothetical protein